LGVALPWPGSESAFLSSIDSYGQLVGSMPKVVQLYRDWTISLINSNMMDGIASRGAVCQVTWEPWDPSALGSQPAYSLAAIAGGSYDSYVKQAAADAKAYGKPFQLRFAPEMNGNWSPWGAGVNGNTAHQYVQAWQHVVGLFRSAGVTNVTWVWCPNNGPSSTIASFWPGSSWVDMLGMDGYNDAGALSAGDLWMSWTQVFAQAYKAIAGLDPNMAIQVNETACNEQGGDKGAWITSAYTQEIPTSFPRVMDVVWFDENKECDWRVNSSAGSLSAYQAVARSADWGGSGGSTPPPTQTLAPPTLHASGISRSSITLTWAAVVGATGYTVECSTDSSFGAPTDRSTSSTSITFGSLTRRTTYWFRAKATALGAESPWSAVVQTRTSR
jgi:beta-mannanase